MTPPPFDQTEALYTLPYVRHGFFGRRGPGSVNNFNMSCNTGMDAEFVTQNRRLAANMVGGDDVVLAGLTQTHSTKIVTLNSPPSPDERPEADGLVTATPNIALAILTADCAPILFADNKAPIIGACHAGWKGAVDGILENTIVAMEALGANRNNIIAAIGPTISGANYEIGSKRANDIIQSNSRAARFIFIPENREREHFDLPGFAASELQQLDLASVEISAQCTYACPDKYFSHRYYTHHKGKQGRQISIISLNGEVHN